MNLWIHSLADGSERQVTRGRGGDYQPKWSPDGRSLVFFSARAGNADIWLADATSGELRRLTTSPWLDINPSFSPDGRLIAFQSDRGGRMEVWLMNADGSSGVVARRPVDHLRPVDAGGRRRVAGGAALTAAPVRGDGSRVS